MRDPLSHDHTPGSKLFVILWEMLVRRRPTAQMECTQADWAEHTHLCEGMRETLDESLASHVAGGRGLKKDFNKASNNISSYVVC